jgi:uncharacterized repeat protein (TIGR01451 family)
VAVGAAAAIASSLLVATPAAAAPFANLEPTVFLAQDSPTQLKSSVQSNGELVFSNVGAASTRTYNAIGYNEQDNFLYGISGTELIRIHDNGATVRVRDVPIGAHVGAFRADTQDFWFTNGTRLFHTNVSNPAGAMIEVTLNQSMPAADFTWANGYFWGLTGAQIVRLSTSGTVTLFAAPPRLNGSAAGGAWTYGNGNLGFTANSTGDISQVQVTNPASATPTFTVISVISGPPSSNNDATASLGQPADLAVTKTFDETRVLAGGDGRFDLTVTNNGPGISSGYTLTDAVPTGLTNLILPAGCTLTGATLTCSGGRLAVGASETFSIGATVDPTLSASTIVNTASVLGNEDDTVTTNNSATDSLIVERAGLTIAKTAELDDANGNGIPDVGETVDYAFLVRNTGSIALTGVTVDDARVDDITPASANIAAGASTTFEASYVVTQADIDAGRIDNTATASGTHDFGTIQSPPSTATIDAPQTPLLQAVKSASLDDANANGVADAGETIDYTVAVTNVGNVTLADVSVADPLVTLTPAAVTLQPGASADFTGTYTVTAADVSRGSVVNTATATGTPPGGTPIESPPTSTTTETASPSLTIVKSADFADANDNGLLDVGEEISYSFVVTNDGNVDITGVTVSDDRVTGLTPTSADVAAGEQVVFTADPYVVTDADVENGSVVNTATATGTPIGGTPIVTPPSTVTVPTVDPVARWALVKQSTLDDTNGNGRADVGETIAYSFLATNTGTLTLTGVTVTDAKVTGITPASATLIPGERILFTADPYTVTQADVDAGRVFNVAAGTATDPGGSPVVPPPAENEVPTPDPAPGLRAVKRAALSDTNLNGVADEGEQIAYTITVTNIGNVTLADVSVSDPKAGAVLPASVATLAPGASVRFTAQPYTVTAADVANGSVDNTATATGTPPSGTPVTATGSTSTETVSPGLAVVKTAALEDANGNGLADPGETITYTFVATNTGNTRLEDVAIDDPRVTSVSPASAAIDVASTQRYTATYEVTEQDILSGTPISNTATATGTVPGGSSITTPPSTAVVPPAPVAPGLTLVKSGQLNDENDNGLADIGETIDYTFVAENTGNVTLTDVSVTDDRVTGLDPLSTTIAPGSTAVFTADPYTVTQADIDAGEVRNQASATGTTPGGAQVPSAPTTDIVPVPDPLGALVADKTAALDDTNGNGVADEGEQIVYTIVLTNTGNVTLSNVSAQDDMVTGLTPTTVASLAPRATTTFVADPYTVTAADVDAGVIVNVATGSGTTPDGDPVVSPPDTVSTPTFDPGMLVEKTAVLDDVNGNGMADLGETVQYTFTVRNTGNVRIDGVSIIDPKVTGITPASASVAPGDSVVFRAAPYAVTEADIIAGELRNSATATGDPLGGDPITTPPSVVNVPPAPLVPALAVDKAARIVDTNGNGIADVGESIEYTITVRNTGNATLIDVVIADPMLTGLTPATVASLAPGASVRATADPYVVTEADAARGVITNVATASGTGPDGSTVGAGSPPVTTRVGALAATGSDVPIVLGAIATLLLVAGAITVYSARRVRLEQV